MRLLLLSTILLFSIIANGQKIGSAYLPAKTKATPQWFKAFYVDGFEKTINVFEIDKKAKAYEKKIEKVFEKTSAKINEVTICEENEDIYVLYYKRWRNAMKDFIEADGTLKENIEIPIEEITSTQRSFNSRSPTSNWSLLGPATTHFRASQNAAQPQTTSQVNIYACAMAASNHNILYAAPETGGIFKTTDMGLNWSLVFDDINVGNSNISSYSGDAYAAVDVHPTDPNTVYIGRKNLIRKSVDGGTNWVTSLTGCGDVNTIAINPSNPDVIYAACNNGLYKTINGGTSWISILPNAMMDVALKTDDPNTVYALRQNVTNMVNLFKSTNAGSTFNQSSWVSNITAGTASRMALTPNDPNLIYVVVLATTASDGNSDKPHIFKTTDAAATWSLMCVGVANSLQGNSSSPLGMSNGQGYYDLDIMANPLNANEVIVGSSTAYKSTNGGVSFTALGGYFGTYPLHPDIQCMIASGNDAWVITDGGMNYSTDFFSSTANLSTRNNGIFATDFWGFTQGWNEDITAGGKYHNGNAVLSENYPSQASIQLGGGESATGYYLMGKKGAVVFSDMGTKGVNIPATFSTPSSSFVFNKLPNEDNFGQNCSEIEFLPYCFSTMFTGNENILWKTTDNGISWVSVNDFGSPVREIEISRSNPDVMYVATDARLWKTINAGGNWTIVNLPIGQSQTEKKLALSYTDENTLWITSPNNTNNNKVFITTNGGTSWTNLTTASINGSSYRNIVQQAGTDGGVYIVAKGAKVFYRNNTMADWVSFSASLPKGTYPLRTLPFYRDGKLRTAGNRGIWEIDFYEDGAPVAQPTVDKLTTNCVRDTFYFDDFSALKQAGATWSWSFSGSPAYVSSTSVRNPKVVYGAMGTYDFSLTVTNAMGTSSKTITSKIVINKNDCGVDTIPGKSLTLTTVGDYAEQTVPLNIATNTMTLSCWIKPNGTQTTTAGIIFSGSGGASGFNFGNNNQLGYHWAGSAGTYNWTGGPTITSGEWSHIALTISPTNATIYLNGIPYSRSGTYTHPSVLFDQIFKFGRDRTSSTRYFIGQMDEVCIYNRTLSQNEIRELMHLTKNNPNAGSLPSNDPSLISYYQFNEDAALPIYDKISNNHSLLLGNANKISISSAPVGGGNFQRLNVTTGGIKDFATPGVELGFPAAGTFPNGDVIVSRINVPANSPAALDVLPNNPSSYYVIRNFGTNATFTTLNSIKFKNVQGTTNAMTLTPNALQLYKRASNAEGATWGSPIDNADAVTNTASIGTVEFSTGLSNNSFSQFSIGLNSAILPVKLISFTAQLQNNDAVLLHWKVAEQLNVKTYQIQFSTNGINFTDIGNVDATNITNYSFNHFTPAVGIHYYRLKMIDDNEAFQFSEIRKITVSSKIALLVNPNPATDAFINFIIKGIGNKINASISITNALGQIVQRTFITDMQNNTMYKIGVPASGIYILKIILSNGTVLTKKVEVK